jgi:putative intracellular protease/amidase
MTTAALLSAHVLLVVTSHDVLGNTGKPTGLWLEELAVPYYLFRDAGLEVDIASIRGGKAPIDPGSIAAAKPGSPAARFQADEAARRKLESTRPIDELQPATYAAVLLVGGHGTMWDFPQDKALASFVGRLSEKGVVAAVCHGPAGLVGVTDQKGNPLVKGKRMTGFTNAEEAAVELTAVVPFALETRLRELGARFEGAAPWAEHAVRDGNLITGQNPSSSERVARLVLVALEEARQRDRARVPADVLSGAER